MKTETRQINKWSGKREGKPSNRKRIVQQTQEGVENVANDPSSPKIAAVNPQTESSINSLPAMAPKTPNTVLSPATVRSSQKSYVESSSGDDVGSTRSSSSQTQHQPSSLSNDDRSFQELRDASASIRNLQALLPAIKTAAAEEVAQILTHCAFRPREAAYTIMIKECGQDVAKALELWTFMKTQTKLTPNTITYSVLIKVCGNAGAWEQAEAIFMEQVTIAKHDAMCRPNAYSYSYLLVALMLGKRFSAVLSWYQHMIRSGVFPDAVLYSHVIGGAIEAKMPLDNLLTLVDGMHYEGFHASSKAYCTILQMVNNEKGWGKAVELFICASVAGAVTTIELGLALMDIFRKAGATLEAAQFLQAYLEQRHTLEEKSRMASAAMVVYAEAGRYQRSIELWKTFWMPRGSADATIAGLVLDALDNGGQSLGFTDLKAELHRVVQAGKVSPRGVAENG